MLIIRFDAHAFNIFPHIMRLPFANPVAYNAAPLDDESIPGANPVDIHRFTAPLRIIGYTGGGVCMGSLIASDLVVTAAHCVRGASSIEVKLFQPDTREPLIRISRRWIFHSSQLVENPLKQRTNEDVAVILIDPAPGWNRPIPLFKGLVPTNDPINPLRDAKNRILRVVDKVYTVSRANEDYFAEEMPKLRVISYSNHEHTSGSRIFSGQVDVPKGLNTYSCQGDSGSPMIGIVQSGWFVTGGLIGVLFAGNTNFQDGTIECGRKAYFYSTSLNVDFIKESYEKLRKQGQ